MVGIQIFYKNDVVLTSQNVKEIIIKTTFFIITGIDWSDEDVLCIGKLKNYGRDIIELKLLSIEEVWDRWFLV